MSISIRELEILAALKRRWVRLYFAELSRLMRELDAPYLFRPRAPSRRRQPDSSAMRRARRRGR